MPLSDSGPIAGQVLVELHDVQLAFGHNVVLKGINLQVRRGQAVSIIGPSGSGKSTILRCITGLLKPHSGSIILDGVDVRALKSEAQLIELRKRVGFVFQQYNLFPHLTVLENLVIAPTRILGKDKAAARREAHALLDRVKLGNKAAAYPGELSGGQQQRVAIARALAMQPELILFDEVTSALDPETVGEVLTVIRELVNDGMTCVLVTHEMRFAEEISDEVYFTEAGLIVEHGSADQIFSAPASERTRTFLTRALNGDARSQARRDEAVRGQGRLPQSSHFSPISFDRLKFSV
jgi:polar amino acid transport system ATP-binding protein